MHTRAAVAVFDAEASNKIATGKVTSDRSMHRPFPTVACAVAHPRHGRWRGLGQADNLSGQDLHPSRLVPHAISFVATSPNACASANPYETWDRKRRNGAGPIYECTREGRIPSVLAGRGLCCHSRCPTLATFQSASPWSGQPLRQRERSLRLRFWPKVACSFLSCGMLFGATLSQPPGFRRTAEIGGSNVPL